MRIAIISDIHGNQVALEAVLQDLECQPAIDQLVIAGDLCLNGPCPRQVLENELVALFMHHGFEHDAHGGLGERTQVLMEDLLVWNTGDDGADVEASGVDVVRLLLGTDIVPS